ncbi:endonuclease/exonuclease/phosphatase family protein [Paraliomyxa miuraensis]|uniref:endonuclease/exonuclease/phosphatase family protein n=1 Tax=Paraliomyxa miuraensis TaxID=376150 RepID=UPI00389AFA82|nr:endonuclease/exonuclease/phosphatase family protein [Paraliomyxa miuraensis]
MVQNPIETIVFWNCGLAPTVRRETRPEPGACETAGRTIRQLVHDGAKVLGLCEVNDASLQSLRRFLPAGFDLHPCTGPVNGLHWDLALAFDSAAWKACGHARRIVARYGNHSYKAGWKRPLLHRSTGVEVAIYVAHWRSRLRDGALGRQRCGQELATSMEKEKRPIVVMGDFNDEPFDKALEGMNTSRDIHLVRDSCNLLFNPFWRHLGHEDRHTRRCGTYFHRNGETTRWRTFDQIIISAEFLQDRDLCYHWAGPAPNVHDAGDHIPVRLDIYSRRLHHDS